MSDEIKNVENENEESQQIVEDSQESEKSEGILKDFDGKKAKKNKKETPLIR